MKYNFIKMFTDIDDELIANAKPEAQRPIELRADTRRSPWRKFAAAAACLAVVAVGGAFAVNALRSGSAVPSVPDAPLDSVVDLPSTQPNSPASSGTVSLIDTEVNYYDSVFHMTNAVDYDGVYMMAGFLQKEYGRGSCPQVLVAVRNDTDKPLVLAKDDKGNPAGSITAQVEGLNSCGSVYEDANTTETILPGETYCRAFHFDTCLDRSYEDRGIYSTEYKTLNVAAAGKYDGTAILKILSDPDDPASEVVSHNMNFTVNIGNWNIGDTVGGYVKIGDEDEQITRWSGPDIFTIRNDFPGVKFECDFRSIYIYNNDGSKTKLFGGEHAGCYFVSDINDDGYGDLFVNVCFEKEGKRGGLIVYDHKNGQFYAIADFDNYNCGAFVEDYAANGYLDRVVFSAHDPETYECLKYEPLTFDMLKPCTFDENGEPVFITRCGLDFEDQ